jgi:hypothetical protein
MDDILVDHCFAVYESPVNVTDENKLVRRARLTPLSEADKSLTLANVWGTKFIQKALTEASAAEDWSFACSKPLLLKDGELVYTWEFALSGDVPKGLSVLRAIDRAPLESKSIKVGETSVALGPPTASTRKVTVKTTQGAVR